MKWSWEAFLGVNRQIHSLGIGDREEDSFNIKPLFGRDGRWFDGLVKEKRPADQPPDQRFVPGGGRSADHLFRNVVSLIGSRFPSEINSRVPDQLSLETTFYFLNVFSSILLPSEG